MSTLRFTLHAEGSSDQALLPIIGWALRQHSKRLFEPQFADLRMLEKPPGTLEQKLRRAVELYPCDLLFVHRDADGPDRERRVREIRSALGHLAERPAICVVPVRMQEAWLLVDEAAIREAAGNPAGRVSLSLPSLDRLESLPDPKQALHEALRIATGLGARRRRRFNVRHAAHRVATLIADFSILRALPAFRAFERDLDHVLDTHGWR